MKWAGLFLIPFCSIFVVAGVMLMRGASRNVRVALKSAGWPTAEARIESSRVSSRTSRNNTVYQVFATYRFAIHDREYAGSTIHPGYEGSSDQEATQALAEKLTRDSVIAVHYDPESPEISTIVPGRVVSTLVPLVGGFMFFSVGLGFVIMVTLGIYFRTDFADLIYVLKKG